MKFHGEFLISLGNDDAGKCGFDHTLRSKASEVTGLYGSGTVGGGRGG